MWDDFWNMKEFLEKIIVLGQDEDLNTNNLEEQPTVLC